MDASGSGINPAMLPPVGAAKIRYLMMVAGEGGGGVSATAAGGGTVTLSQNVTANANAAQSAK
jgi:hypothetical protein